MDTKSEILDYIKRKETAGALLITGKWGCGKTSLIKDLQKDLNQGNEFAVVMISLFGVDSIELLTKKIKQAISYIKMIKVEGKSQRIFEELNIKGKASVLASALADYSKIAKGANALLSVDFYDFINIEKEIICFDKSIKKNQSISKKLVLIFDDFERCDIDKVVLLGAINDYVENRGIKSIVVADEEKIDDDSYDEFKEKAIFKTIKIKSNYSEIIRNIISFYNESVTDYKEFLMTNIDVILCAFNDTQYENIRIIKSVIYDFERVFNTWRSFGKGETDLPIVLYEFIAISSEYKAGNYNHIEHYNLYLLSAHIENIEKETDEKKKSEMIKFANDQIRNKYRENTFTRFFQSLSKYIVDGDWNENDFYEELEKRYNITELSDSEKFFAYTIWELDSKTLKSGLQSAIQLAYDGKLNCDQLIQLFLKVNFLRTIDTLPVDNIDYSKIGFAFDERIRKIKNQEIVEKSARIYDDDNNVDDEAKSIILKIKTLDNKIIAWTGYNKIRTILQGNMENWQINMSYSIIDVFDDDLLSLFITKYDSSSNADKRKLSRMLLQLNWEDNKYSTNDEINISHNNLNNLLLYIDEKIDIETDKITQYVLKDFKMQLTEVINKS